MILYFSALIDSHRSSSNPAIQNPLFVALLSGFFLSESSPANLGSAMISFLGIILIVSPDLRTVERCITALGSGFFAGVAYLYEETKSD